MGSIFKFVFWVVKIAFVLGALGILKDETLVMAGKVAHAEQHMISYSKFARMLTTPQSKKKAHHD